MLSASSFYENGTRLYQLPCDMKNMISLIQLLYSVLFFFKRKGTGVILEMAKKTGAILQKLRACMKDTKYVTEPIHAYIVTSADPHMVSTV